MTATAVRRDLLLALAALGLAPPPAAAAEPGLAAQIGPGAAALREAYLAAEPGETSAELIAKLLPNGWTAEAEAALRRRIVADHRMGRLFIFQGWRLSRTEAQLLAAVGG